MRTEWRYPEGRPSYEVVVACSATGDPEGREALLADLTAMMTPAPVRAIEAWLAELSVLVARRPQDEVDEAIRLTAYAGRLAVYPADVARAALLDHRWRFWPTWEELAAVCDGMTSRRRQMILAVSAPQESGPVRRMVTEDERRRAAEFAGQYVARADMPQTGGDTPPFPHWSGRMGPSAAAEQLRRARIKAGTIAEVPTA